MRTLSSEDAFFLYLETPDQHQHVIATMILDPSTMPAGFDIQDLIDNYEAGLRKLPEFSQKLVRTPFAMTPPVLVDDPDFVFRNHIHRIAVPAPGTLKQLAMIVEDIASTPLSHRRPLWESWFISGLEDGRLAVIFKTHHCLADGIQGIKSLSSLFDTTAVPASVDHAGNTSRRPPLPGEVASRALYNQWRYRPGYFDVMGRTVRSLRSRRKLFGESGEIKDMVPALFEEAPKLKFNAPITPNRTIALGSLSLPAVKFVKRTLGITVNDVVLSACTLALRQYLIATDDLPDQPLICCLPVSLSLKGQECKKPDQGNQVGTMSVRLPVQLEDTAELVQTVCRSTRASKNVFDQSFQNLMQNYIGVMPPGVADWALKSTMKRNVVKYAPTSANLVISNVPGPPMPLYMSGARVDLSYGIGPIVSGQGPNITFVSYADKMNFSIQACREQMPDIWMLAEGIEAALDQLEALAQSRGEALEARAAETG